MTSGERIHLREERLKQKSLISLLGGGTAPDTQDYPKSSLASRYPELRPRWESPVHKIRKHCFCGLDACARPPPSSALPTPNSSAEILMPSVMILGGGDFGRCLCCEGRALLTGISAVIKETPKNSLAPSAMWGHSGKAAAYHLEEGLY